MPLTWKAALARGAEGHCSALYAVSIETGMRLQSCCGERAEKWVVLRYAMRQQAGKIARMQQIIVAVAQAALFTCAADSLEWGALC